MADRKQGHSKLVYDKARRTIITVNEIAAERDRLKASNTELVAALVRVQSMVGAPHDFTIGDCWQAQKQADTALANANAKASTEPDHG